MDIIGIVVFVFMAVMTGAAVYSHLKSQDAIAQSLKEISANIKETNVKMNEKSN